MAESEPEQSEQPASREPGAAAPAAMAESVATIATPPLDLKRNSVPLPGSLASAIDEAMAAAVQTPPTPARQEVQPVPALPAAVEVAKPEEPGAPGPSEASGTGPADGPPAAAAAPGPAAHATKPPAEARPQRAIPTYEWPKARPPAPPAPATSAPEPRPPGRTPLGDILVSYAAALAALVALALAIYLEMQNRARTDGIVAELASLRAAIEAIETRSPAAAEPQPLDFPINDGTIDALIALQKRIAALEDAAASAPTPAAALPDPGPLGATELADSPTEDCIPIDTRFVALPGEAYPICRTPEVITLATVTADSVTTDAGANVVEGGFTRLGFGSCTLLVISADVEGFAELRVTCS